MKMIETLEMSEVTERFNNIDSWVRGEIAPRAVEEKSTFTAFIDDLKSNVDTAAAEVDTDELRDDQQARAKLAFAAALYRDARYVLAGRGRLQELGIHNMYREAYQVGKEVSTLEYKYA